MLKQDLSTSFLLHYKNFELTFYLAEVSQHQSSSEETDDLTSTSNSISSNVPVNEDEKKSTRIEKLEKSVQPKEEFKNQNSESSLDLGDEKIEDSMKTLRKSPTKKNRKAKGENSETSKYFSRGCE